MSDIFRTKTFWSAVGTGITGIIASCGVADPVLNNLPWFFGTLTAVFMRAGVLKSEAPIIRRPTNYTRN